MGSIVELVVCADAFRRAASAIKQRATLRHSRCRVPCLPIVSGSHRGATASGLLASRLFVAAPPPPPPTPASGLGASSCRIGACAPRFVAVRFSRVVENVVVADGNRPRFELVSRRNVGACRGGACSGGALVLFNIAYLLALATCGMLMASSLVAPQSFDHDLWLHGQCVSCHPEHGQTWA